MTSLELRERANQKLGEGFLYRQRREDRLTNDFILSAGYEDIEAIRAAISAGVDVNAIGADGHNALGFAALHGRLDIVKLLVKAGANLELASDRLGVTPLVTAVVSGRAELVRFLIRSGANVNTQDRAGEKVLRIAIRKRNIEVIQLLRNAGATEV